MKSLATFSVTVIAAAMLIPALGQPKAALDAIKDRVHTLEGAYNKGDVAAILAFTDEEYTWEQIDGKKLTRLKTKDALTDDFKTIQSGKWDLKVKSALVTGSVALVDVQVHFRGYKLDPDHKPYQYELLSTERQNWSQDSGVWKIHDAAVLSLKNSTNGKWFLPDVDDTKTVGSTGGGVK